MYTTQIMVTPGEKGDVLSAADAARPYRVEITADNGYVFRGAFDTADGALAARDRAFDYGFKQVRVLGLEPVVYAAGFADDEDDLVLIG